MLFGLLLQGDSQLECDFQFTIRWQHPVSDVLLSKCFIVPIFQGVECVPPMCLLAENSRDFIIYVTDPLSDVQV